MRLCDGNIKMVTKGRSFVFRFNSSLKHGTKWEFWKS